MKKEDLKGNTKALWAKWSTWLTVMGVAFVAAVVVFNLVG
jgi:hypothetical protein